VIALCAAAPASASTWTLRELPDNGVRTILWGASCPSTSLCVAVGTNSVLASSTNPTGDASAWSIAHLEKVVQPIPGQDETVYPGNAIKGVSCPSSSFCAAAGPQGHIFTSTDPTAGAAAWTVTALAEPFDLRAVSCAGPGLCAATDLAGNVLTSTDPTAGAGAWVVSQAPAGAKPLLGVSCPTTELCVAANAGQVLTSTSPAAPAPSWNAFAAGSGYPVTAMSCPSASACAGIDNNADPIVSTDPTAGSGAWFFTNVIPSTRTADGAPTTDSLNGMYGISCPTPALCVAVGQDRKVITSTDPFAPSAPPSAAATGKAKRLRVTITSHPPKRSDARRGGVEVRFGFRADAVGVHFKCRLAARRFESCRSPRRYRAGQGRHAFKVFAISQAGLKGPVTTYRFRVGRILEQAPTPTCGPGQKSTTKHPCQTPR
jgi:hypothetical protein